MVVTGKGGTGKTVLAAALALWIAWGLWSGLRVKVPTDGAFLIEVEKKKTGTNVLLRGKLTNRGEDIPEPFRAPSAELQKDGGWKEKKLLLPWVGAPLRCWWRPDCRVR